MYTYTVVFINSIYDIIITFTHRALYHFKDNILYLLIFNKNIFISKSYVSPPALKHINTHTHTHTHILIHTHTHTHTHRHINTHIHTHTHTHIHTH